MDHRSAFNPKLITVVLVVTLCVALPAVALGWVAPMTGVAWAAIAACASGGFLVAAFGQHEWSVEAGMAWMLMAAVLRALVDGALA